MRTQQRTDAVWTSSRALLLAPALLLFVAASSHAASDGAGSSADSRITVTNVGGDVDVTMAGNAEAVSPNSTVLLPARIVTGHDGTLGLTQAGTSISVSNDTDVEIPAEAVDGNLVARLVQHSGNVFYDVAPRDIGKLRVETPFLVAVIKGTQFNVAVADGTTTISLFEGRLELLMPDDGDVVELNAGEIAIRSLIDDSIRIIGMDDLRAAVPPPPAAPAARNDAEVASTAAPERRATAADAAVAVRVNDVSVGVDTVGIDTKEESLVAVRPSQASTVVDAAVLTGSAITVDLPDEDSPGLGLGRDGEHPGLGVGRGAIDGGGGVGLPVDVGLDTRLDIGTPSVEVGLDLGDALDVGLETGLDLDTVADTDASVTVDNGQIDLIVDSGLDLDLNVDPPGSVDLDLHVNQGNDTPGTPRRRLGGLQGVLP